MCNKRLNLGCGEFKKKGYVNVDYFSTSKPDITHDLNRIPYPFEDNEFELVEADHVLEHLDDPFAVLKEIRRITKNNGLIIIRVPHFSRGFTHPDHKRGFDASLPLYFNKSFTGGYKGFELRLRKMRLNWFAQPYLKKTTLSRLQYCVGFVLGKVFNFLANISIYACSRIWCFWVGGFEEIEFQFLVEKND